MGGICSDSREAEKVFTESSDGGLLRTSKSQECKNEGKSEWGYPYKAEEWIQCCPGYRGNAQSPIDLPAAKLTLLPKSAEVMFDYHKFGVDLLNNGRTIQMNISEETGCNVSFGGDKWQLVQFHFHTKSEHTVDEKAYDLEMHLVHKNAKGALLVFGVFFDSALDKANAFLDSFWDDLPAKNQKAKAGTTVDFSILMDQLICPFFVYNGSLTTPPLSEGVQWIVQRTNLTCSKAQLQKFVKQLGIPHNARPTQPVNGRVIQRMDQFALSSTSE